METRLLRYFLTVAHEENITRAAEVLHITQPTLSRQLVQLEEETGVTLFIRGKRKITLTPEGMLLRRRAEEILSLVDKTEKELLQQDALVEGTISIGCGELNSVNLLAQIIKDFKALYPKVKFNLHTGNSDRLKEQLEQGLIDIALLLEPVSIEKYDFLRLPVKERWGVIMPTGCALAAKKSITARDLTGLPLITGRRATINNELNNWIGRELRNLNIVFTTDLAANAILVSLFRYSGFQVVNWVLSFAWYYLCCLFLPSYIYAAYFDAEDMERADIQGDKFADANIEEN